MCWSSSVVLVLRMRFCFFKQKTAYEMRISDGSSDVCSSDLGALLIAAGELADQRDVHAADEADLAGLRLHGGDHADQEGALMLLEHDGAHIGQLDHGIDDGKAGIRKFLGDLGQGVRLRSEEHTSELQSLMRISYAVFCLKK